MRHVMHPAHTLHLKRAAVACCGPKGLILATESLRSEKVTRAFRQHFCAPGEGVRG